MQDLLKCLCSSEKQHQAIYGASNRLRANVILTNGQRVRFISSLEDVKLELKEGDEVTIFPFASGG